VNAGEPLIRTFADVAAFERVPLEQRANEWTVHAVVNRGVQLNPEAVALHYLLDANPDETPLSYTFAEFLRKTHQTANLLRRLFKGGNGVCGALLPLVPENYFLLAGAPSAGILCPVNWALKAPQIAAILSAARTDVLVTLGPTPGFNIWETALEVLKLAPGIRHVLQVRGPNGDAEPDRDFATLIARERADDFDFERDIDPGETAIYCATGGTTGIPKLAKFTHRGIATNATRLRGCSGTGRAT
jgi:fatty-acyl-CoA synthase